MGPHRTNDVINMNEFFTVLLIRRSFCGKVHGEQKQIQQRAKLKNGSGSSRRDSKISHNVLS
eukprot:769441-Prorocentrum_lima.AAC.1